MMGRIAIDGQLEGPRMGKFIDADTTKPPLNARTEPTLLICLVTGTIDRVGNSTYASAWTAVQFFFSNWSPIEAYLTVLQYDSSILYVLMSSDPIRRFVLQFNDQISLLASNCLDILYYITTSKTQKPPEA
jgi:hypothetical protein